MERQRGKKISDDQSTSKGNSNQIPFDLIPEIFKRLPVKTLARFLCVSKECASVIRNRDFIKSYLIKSSTQPPRSLIFTFKDMKIRNWKHFFFSASQPQIRGESSSSSSVATYHMNCHSQPYTTFSASVHGLICHGPPSEFKVYNPSTRRSITLPSIDSERDDMHHFLGYDPINGDYKVLCMIKGLPLYTLDSLAQELRVLTLGNGNSWRMIQDFPPHFLDSPYSPDICINGVLYYGAFLDVDKIHAVMRFDVRSEKFDLIKLPVLPAGHVSRRLNLTNYEGKLTVLFSEISDRRIDLCVLEDDVKHEWSIKFYVLPTIDTETYHHFHPFCATDEGELVLAVKFIMCPEPFSVLYYDPKKNIVRRVYIEGIFTEQKDPLWDKDSVHGIFSIFFGQIDNLMFL